MKLDTGTDPNSPTRECRECERLRVGTRSHQHPHEYLVKTHTSEATGASIYRCLLCRADITCSPFELSNHRRWWRWTPVPSR